MIALATAVALAFAAAPAKSTKTQLKIDVKPAAAVVYVDGQRKGTGAKTILLNVTPGNHTIRVVHKKDQTTEVVRVKQGQTLSWGIEFEDSSADKAAKSAAKAKEDTEAQAGGSGRAAEEKGPFATDSELGGPDLK